MLAPQMWLRKFRLRRAIRDYPLYDPPHKVEEYRLSRDQAVDNFDYFMRVRQQRTRYFQRWVRRYFQVAITLDEAGVRALSRWGNRYAGLLIAADPTGNPSDSYFTYDPSWTGEHAANNVLFDLGITLGEIIIAKCPKLHWDVHPMPAVLPRTTRMLKRSPGMSFQRPKLTGFDDPIGEVSPLHGVHFFASQMLRYTTTFDGIKRYLSLPKRIRGFIRDELFNSFESVLRDYPAGYPNRFREQMSPKDYFAFVDDLESEVGEDRDD